jgi:hypothetical protein
MTKTRIVDNRNRPAQPEPDEDPAFHAPPIREQGTRDIREHKDDKHEKERNER